MTHYTNTNNPIDFPKSENKMNERIKELMKQADYPAPEIALRAQRLVELIIRECGVALNPMLRDMISRGQAYDLIKEHFGVEE